MEYKNLPQDIHFFLHFRICLRRISQDKISFIKNKVLSFQIRTTQVGGADHIFHLRMKINDMSKFSYYAKSEIFDALESDHKKYFPGVDTWVREKCFFIDTLYQKIALWLKRGYATLVYNIRVHISFSVAQDLTPPKIFLALPLHTILPHPSSDSGQIPCKDALQSISS